MKKTMRTITLGMRFAAAVLLSLGLVLPASAGLIVDWDKANYTANAPLNDPLATDSHFVIGAASNPSGFIQNWNPGSAIMDATIAAGGGAVYSNKPLYGIIQTKGETALSGLDTAGDLIRGDGNNAGLIGQIWFGINGTVNAVPGANAIAGILSIQAADFLAGGVSPGDTISSMVIDIFDQRTSDTATTRLAVKSGGTWYVSDDNLSGEDLDGHILSYTGADWAAMTASTAGSTSLMTGTGLTYNIPNSALNDIEEVGFFFEGQLAAASTARARIRVNSIEVTTVPEGSTFCLLALGSVLAVGMNRHRRS
ncbi:hypothetical protein Pla144_45790 [Bythopirellula polymerisocia]|uniref:PEP-CTERM protein-sorting domain-containing protein n=2 Tax=Bythopirellula polymerisocia TaxID=2528003 RepID=A0A5C6CEX7_9BACT|nr:hypothetical protein Pla144_45790 [Bythopirellula polymerisocia]